LLLYIGLTLRGQPPSVKLLPQPAEPSRRCIDIPPDASATCLDQALWGKCSQPYMRRRCDRSCGRCAAPPGRPVTLLSSRQAAPCNTTAGEGWVASARANKAWFAALHRQRFVWSVEQVDPAYSGAWNKLALLRRHLRQELAAGAAGGWILWMDWDVIVTDARFELPLAEYEERNYMANKNIALPNHIWL